MGKIKTKISLFFSHFITHLKKNRLFYLVLTPLLIGVITFSFLYVFLVLPKTYVSELTPTELEKLDNLTASDETSTSSQSDQSATNATTPNTTATPQATPTPAPAATPTPEYPTIVAFYGDSQSDSDEDDVRHQAVVNYILGTAAYTVFHAGDLLEDGTVDSLNRFNAVTATLRATLGFYSAPGNNERDSSVYFDNFVYPGNEHYFSVNVGNLHMVILDNYALPVSVGSAQYNWLESDLQTADSQNRITGVMFHYPIYGSGGDWKGMIGSMVPLFQSYGVDFVISGHEHAYQKAFVDGIYYLVVSGQTSLGYMIGNIYSNRGVIYVYNQNNSHIDTINFNAR